MRASSLEAITQQGRVCAINDDGTMIAIANEFAIWLFEVALIPSESTETQVVSIKNVSDARDSTCLRAHEPFITYPGECVEYMVFDNTRVLRAVVAGTQGNEARIVYDARASSCSSACASLRASTSHDALDAFVPDARIAMSSNGQTQVDARGSAQEKESKDDCCAKKVRASSESSVGHVRHTVIVKHDPRTGKIIVVIDLPNPARTVSICASGAHGLICMENGALAHIY
jgi:hypothetical protein